MAKKSEDEWSNYATEELLKSGILGFTPDMPDIPRGELTQLEELLDEPVEDLTPVQREKRNKLRKKVRKMIESRKPKTDRKAKGGLIKSRKKPKRKSIDGLARKGKTKAKHR
tara:strand:- start:763 stop:1098 length:336 start_codon:yes stop_codon:yes gene_type:complete